MVMFSPPAAASHPFPAFDPAYFKPGATPPELALAPWILSGDHQTVDGKIAPVVEYAGGKKAILEDWYTGMPPGDMHLQLAGQRLLMGVRVAPGSCSSKGCAVFVAIDENRSDTLAQPAKPFGPEDRGFFVYWTTPSNPKVGEWSGAYQVGHLPQSLAWPVMAQVGMGKDGKYHVELKITMRTAAANAHPNPNPRTEPFGLAVAVVGGKQESSVGGGSSLDPSYYIWPNQPMGTGGQWIAMPNYPYTYMTINPELPTTKPTSFLTYNVGMLPFYPDGGDGTPADFAAYAADPEVTIACLQETWDHGQRREIATLARELGHMHAVGLPQPCGGADDDGCDAGELVDQAIADSGLAVKDTGLLLLSRSPIVASDVMYYDQGCVGADCMERKGALWARIGTATAKREITCNANPDIQQSCPGPVYAAEDYIDVFCTHLQASCDMLASPGAFVDSVVSVTGMTTKQVLETVGVDSSFLEHYECDETWYEPVQEAQVRKLGHWIEEVRNGSNQSAGQFVVNYTDRPAILMGDFNINGRSQYNLFPDNGQSRYDWMARRLGAYDRTTFEKATKSLYSNRHDINLGFHNVGQIPPVRGTDPVYVDQVSSLAQQYPSGASLPIRLFGESTKAKDHDVESWRYDYVWALPARESDELPYYAIAATPEEPYVTVDLHNGNDSEPASDHAAVYAKLRFVRLGQLHGYNPTKAHLVNQSVVHITTLSDDGALSGGEDFYGYGSTSFNPGAQYHFTAPSDSDSVSVNWSMSGILLPTDPIPASWWYDLWEDDTSTDDHYDMQSWDGLDVKTSFRAAYSSWQFWETSQNPTVKKQLCLAGLLANCPTAGGTMMPVIETFGNPWNESAEVSHMLWVKEQP